MDSSLVIHIITWVAVALHTIGLFRAGKLAHSFLGVNPLLVAAAIQGGAGLVSSLLRRPDVPDAYTPALAEARRGRARIQELLDNRLQNLEATQAARGVTGSGGAGEREAIMRAAGSTVADIDASLADMITEAGNRQRMLEFQDAQAQYNARQQGISQLANAAGSAYSLNQLLNAQTTSDPMGASAPPIASPPPVPSQSSGPNDGKSLFFVDPLVPTVNPLTGAVTFGFNPLTVE